MTTINIVPIHELNEYDLTLVSAVLDKFEQGYEEGGDRVGINEMLVGVPSRLVHTLLYEMAHTAMMKHGETEWPPEVTAAANTPEHLAIVTAACTKAEQQLHFNALWAMAEV